MSGMNWRRWRLTRGKGRVTGWKGGVGGRARVRSKPIVLQLSGMTQRNWNRSLGVFCAQADEEFE